MWCVEEIRVIGRRVRGRSLLIIWCDGFAFRRGSINFWVKTVYQNTLQLLKNKANCCKAISKQLSMLEFLKIAVETIWNDRTTRTRVSMKCPRLVSYFGYLARRYDSMEKLVVVGWVEGNRRQGRFPTRRMKQVKIVAANSAVRLVDTHLVPGLCSMVYGFQFFHAF